MDIFALVWASIGVISLRLRRAYRAQGRELSDLPYKQPLFPLLPVTMTVLAVLMFAAEGCSSRRKKGRRHFILLMEVDFESDAVWKELQDRLDERVHREDERRARGPIRNMWSGVAEMFHKL